MLTDSICRSVTFLRTSILILCYITNKHIEEDKPSRVFSRVGSLLTYHTFLEYLRDYMENLRHSKVNFRCFQ